MSSSDNEFRELLNRLRQNDEAAGREFVEKFGPHILRIVRRRLHQSLRSKFDSDDFVQAVWGSFFAVFPNLPDCTEPAQFSAYLATLVRNKTIDELRRQSSSKRSGRKPPSADAPAPPEQAPDDIASPSEAAVAHEVWNQLRKDRHEISLRVLELRLSGATFNEIAERLGVNERTARRIVRRSRRRLDAGDDEPPATSS